MGRPIPPENRSFPWGIWTPSWFLGLTWVLNPYGISIGLGFLHGSLLWQTDRPRFSVSNNRSHTYIVRRCGLIRTSGQTPPQMDGTTVFAMWRQCASHLIYAYLDPPKSTSQTASTRCVIIIRTPNFEGQTLVNMRFICTKISGPRHEVMLREVLQCYQNCPPYVLPLPCNVSLNMTSMWTWPTVIDTTVRQWRTRLHACVKAKGWHSEHRLCQ